ncbi:MAG TPA: SRPBCC family protein [Thermoanaerobaculia bacterium]|nr:SRPBCC family protein [Thermoanaerobaculia bacterium]
MSETGNIEVEDPTKLSFEFQATQYLSSFASSSNTVRYILVALMVASLLLFGAHRNLTSWFGKRIEVAREAAKERIWDSAVPCHDLTEKERAARHWADRKGFESAVHVQSYVDTLTEAHTEHLVLPKIPVLGIAFDANDLGFYGGITLMGLLLFLAVAMRRQHENLFLCLWWVRQVWEKEAKDGKVQGNDSPDQPHSRANLLYHALVMSQQFAHPPSRARWQLNPLEFGTVFLLFFPLWVQVYGLRKDWLSRSFGHFLSEPATTFSLRVQVVTLVFNSLVVLLCIVYSRSNQRRWRKAFAELNPFWPTGAQPSTWQWLQLDVPIRGRKAKHSADSTASPARIWELLSDLDQWPKWQADWLERAEPVGNGGESPVLEKGSFLRLHTKHTTAQPATDERATVQPARILKLLKPKTEEKRTWRLKYVTGAYRRIWHRIDVNPQRVEGLPGSRLIYRCGVKGYSKRESMRGPLEGRKDVQDLAQRRVEALKLAAEASTPAAQEPPTGAELAEVVPAGPSGQGS